MIQTNFLNDCNVRKVVEKKGCFSIVEFERDISVEPSQAISAYFAAKMNIKKRQLVAELNNNGLVVQAGAMQMMVGNINVTTNIKGAGDFFKKAVGSKLTGETAVKPHYHGSGQLILEPTYKHLLLVDLANWNGEMVIEDGLFFACEDTVDMKIVSRNNLSSAALGGQGLFNNSLTGHGVVVLESPVPKEELIVIDLKDDVLKVDGNMAIAWSNSLKFTVEKTTANLVGSVASGEGLVNVFRGTGRVLVAPVQGNITTTSLV